MEIKSVSAHLDFSDERFTKRIIHKKDDSVVFVLNFMPGQELPSHQHPGTAVYLLVLEGEGEVTVDGESTKVAKNDCIWLDGEEHFAFRNSSDERVSLYVMLAKIPSERYAQDV